MSNPVSIDRSNVTKDWHARGFSCGLWIDHAGREWSYPPRQSDELFILMSGKLELELDGQSSWPSVGEEIRIPAGMPHTIRNIGGKTARWLYGQQREAITLPQTPDTSHEHSFQSEVRRKRRPTRRESALEVSKET